MQTGKVKNSFWNLDDSVQQSEAEGRQWHSYSVQAGLLTGEGEGESQRKTGVLHAHVVKEVADTLHYMIKQLEEGKHI